jgi:peptide/nickel transport system substrate-binding protein
MQFDLTGLSQPTVSISSSPRLGRRRWLGIMALTGALTVTLAGTATAAPAKGGAANLAMVGEPQGLDPMTSTADLVGTIMQHVYEPLYTFDANWNIAPMLAESMPVVSKDGLSYSITLRKGVMLHNGRELNAEDAVASLNRWMELSPAARLSARKSPR